MELTRDKLKSGLTQFYTLLTKAPYIESSYVLHPPPGQKWNDICEEELHKRGKTAKGIEILRHLPYLKSSGSEQTERWMIGPHSHAITYCEGDIYSEELDVIQPTPGHCIWLASPAKSEDGIGLILDIKNGTITEYSTNGSRPVGLDSVDYESLPIEDRWMAHFTLPIADFFSSWINKYTKLEWMPYLLKPNDHPSKVTWIIRPGSELNLHVDDDLEDSDDSDEDYEPNSEGSEDDDDYDSDEYDPYEFDSDYESDDTEDLSEGQDDLTSEIHDLKLDDIKDIDDSVDVSTHGGNGKARENCRYEIRSSVEKLLVGDQSAMEHAVNVCWMPSNDGALPRVDFADNLKEAYSIYIRNGWPTAFDRDACRHHLKALMDEIQIQAQ